MKMESIVLGITRTLKLATLRIHHALTAGTLHLVLGVGCCVLIGCSTPQNCPPNAAYPGYPAYPGYAPGYTLPSGTTVPTVGAPTMGTAAAPPAMMGQPLPGSVPAYPTLAPGQPIPPGYATGVPGR